MSSMFFVAFSLVISFFICNQHNYYFVRACSPALLDNWIDNVQLLKDTNDDILVTTSNDNCYLFNVPYQEQTYVECSSYSDKKTNFTSADIDPTSTIIDMFSFSNGNTSTVDIEITRNDNTFTISSYDFFEGIDTNTNLTSNYISYNFWTVNDIYTTIILFQTGIDNQETFFAIAIQFENSSINNNYTITNLNLLNNIADYGYIWSNNNDVNSQPVWQDLSIVYLYIELNTCTYTIYTNYYLKWENEMITGLGLYSIDDVSSLAIDTNNKRGYDWKGIYISDTLYTYFFNVNDSNGNVSYTMMSYEWEFTGSSSVGMVITPFIMNNCVVVLIIVGLIIL